MREALLFLGLDLRGLLRGRGARAGLVLAAGAMAAALLLAPGAGPLAATWLAWVLGALAVLLAAGGAALLPGDRLEGRAEWLATLRPAPAQRRAGALLSIMVLCVGVSLAAGLAVGLLGPALGVAPEVSATRDLSPKRPLRLRDPAAAGAPQPVVIALGGTREAPARLVIEARPRGWYATLGEPGPLTLATQAGDEAGSVEVPWRGRIEVPVPPDAAEVKLTLAQGDHDLAIQRIWLLEGRRPAWISWAWVGLLLGLFGACLAPLAVTLSRFTSAPTAAAATLVVVLVAAMRVVLPDLADVPLAGTLEQAAAALLRGVVAIAPDLRGLAVAAEPANGRAVGAEALDALRPLLPHAAGWCLLLLVPRLGADPEEHE